jgi:hypothetical protein
MIRGIGLYESPMHLKISVTVRVMKFGPRRK